MLLQLDKLEGASKGKHLEQNIKYNWAKYLEFLRPNLSFVK